MIQSLINNNMMKNHQTKSINTPNILIVDDIEDNLFLLKKNLEKINSNIHEASNGIQALEISKENDFALFILDVKMPLMDGFELATKLKKIKRNKYTPIIFISANYVNNENISLGYQSGAVDYITKPYKSRVLASKVNIFLTLYHNKKEIELLNRKLNSDLETQIDNRKLAENELTKKEVNFKTLFNSLTDFILILDMKGNMITFNDFVPQRLGYKTEEMKGKNILLIYPTEIQKDALAIFKRMLVGEINRCNLPLITKTKEIIEVETKVTHGTWDGKETIFFMSHDITRRKHAEEQLSEKIRELENFRELAVGRELTMIDLKKEVNKLLKKTNEKPKY